MAFPSIFDNNSGSSDRPQRNISPRKVVTGLGIAVGLLVFLSLVVSGCTTISPGNVGIEVSKVGSSRGVQDLTIKTGLVLCEFALHD